MKDKPLLFCLTSTRNYAWCTRAFLEANTRWADYVVIVDQMSTDGTREMAAEYSNVVVLDNEDLTYSETKRCEMALNYARSVQGDKILVYLAIDEVLPANFQKTKDWQKVLLSQHGDVFCLNWANILLDGKHYFGSGKDDMFQIFHDDGVTPFDNQGKDMHTHTLPYPNNGTDYIIKDFPILHFGYYNVKWKYVKNHYYQMVDYDKNHGSIISLHRYYCVINEKYDSKDINQGWLYKNFDLLGLVDVTSRPLLCDYMLGFIKEKGIDQYCRLNIWQPEMLGYLEMKDPRKWYHKILHKYLDLTQPYRGVILVRAIDKILKFLV